MVWMGVWVRRWPVVALVAAAPLACGEDRGAGEGGPDAGARAGRSGASGKAGRGGESQGDGGVGPEVAGAPASAGGGASGGRAGSGSGGRGGVDGTAGEEVGGGSGSGPEEDGGTAGVAGLAGAGGPAGGSPGRGGSPSSAGAAGTGGPTAVGGTVGVGGTAAVGGTAGELGEGGFSGDGGEEPDDGEACYSGAAPTRGVGICRDGVRHDGGPVCAGEVTPASEACNQEDDDCDGAVDEGFAAFTCGVGACAKSVVSCAGGAIQACDYGSRASGDACNGIDDDCDGGIDEDCSACVRVSLGGNDASGAASNGSTPFRNVQAAIDFAASTPGAPKRVCIAAGATCAAGTTATFAGPNGAPLTMRNGVSVSGKYESTGWTRCDNASNVTTVLAPATAEGVLFPSGVVDETVLFGVSVMRASVEAAAGVTVDGARNVLVAGVTVSGGVGAEHSYGVEVKSDAELHLFRSTIDGGTGTVESVGVHVVGARALIEESTVSGKSAASDGTSIGVILDSAVGSRVTASEVSAGFVKRDFNVIGVLITGDATGVVVDHATVTAHHGAGYDLETAVGIALYDCSAGTPWITENEVTTIGVLADEGLAFGIRAVACYPTIDQNAAVSVYRRGSYFNNGRAVAVMVACEGDGTGRACTLAGNRAIAGESWQGGSLYNVVCTGGGCSRVSRNSLLGRRSLANVGFMHPDCQSSACGRRVTGISGGQFIDHNTVEAGCSRTFSGIAGGNRVLGNVVLGHDERYCVRTGPGPNAPSNSPTADETGVSGGAYYDFNEVRVAQTYDTEPQRPFNAASLSGFVYRHNTFTVTYDFDPVVVETRTPRRFERNHLEGLDALYYDIETGTSLTTAAEIDDLTDMISFGNTD
jgi:hypothetical protein